MMSHRSVVRFLAAFVMLSLIGAFALAMMWWFQHNGASIESLAPRLEKHGAVVATTAKIERDSPAGSRHGGWNTLVLVRPTLIRHAEQVPTSCFLIVPEEPWVTGQVDVATQKKAELNLAQNLHAILPSVVTLYAVDEHRRVRRIDAHRVNYLRIEDSPLQPTSKPVP